MSTPGHAPSGTLELQSLYKAILDAAMDAVVTIDQHGRVLEWNIAAELIFGYRADDAVGRELAELIVPVDTRHLYRSGLHRLAGGGSPSMLDRRVEVTGQRANGSAFPVELTITRLVSTSGVTYAGFLRDISDRHRMLADLKASRSRLITVSDEARRRVERDLHDGAQLQLVALAIALSAARAQLDQDPAVAAQMLDSATEVLLSAISELRDLARGIHSPALAERGLAAGIGELARRSAIPVQVSVGLTERLAEHVETTTFYVVAEALTNAAKHGAQAASVLVELVGAQLALLRTRISDDGPGGADVAKGTGLIGLRDRLAAIDGQFEIISGASGTTLIATVPLSAQGPDAA